MKHKPDPEKAKGAVHAMLEAFGVEVKVVKHEDETQPTRQEPQKGGAGNVEA